MSRIGVAASGASTPRDQRSNAARECETATLLPLTRPAFLQAVQQELKAQMGSGSRAALILLEVDAAYQRRSARPIAEALQNWPKRGPQKIRCGRVDETRYAIFVAPIGFGAQARRLAEQLTHALDPRVCPLLRRALPYACWGVGVFPEAGADAAMLLAAAGRDLEQRRGSGSGCVRMMRPRRRALPPAALAPLAVR